MRDRSESERRLRAAVRVALSPGVWLAVAADSLLILLLQVGAGAGMPQQTLVLRVMLAGTVLVGLLYIMGGAYQGLARSRETVSATTVLRAAAAVFSRFLWLSLKLSLLAAVLLNVMVSIVVLVTGQELTTLVERYGPSFGWLTGLVLFLFVYWLPVVFVRGDFRLLATLRTALVLAVRRLPRSGFLALLILGPAFVRTLLPATTSGFVVALINVAAALMGFMAYVYCVEWLQDHPEAGIP